MKTLPNNINKIKFDNSFSKLPNKFYANVIPTPVKEPNLIKFNDTLATQLGTAQSSSAFTDRFFVGANNIENIYFTIKI